MPKHQLLYRSTRVLPGRTAAAVNLTPRALGWDRIHFAVRHLAAGATWSGLSRDEERCIVLLRGEFVVTWAGARHRVGPRADVFLGYPHAVYLPGPARRSGSSPRSPAKWPIAALRRRALWRRGSSCPEDCGYEIRGGGNATRQIVDIVPPGFPADRLLLCEVYTPGGNWSSYPPHKHDTDDPPREADLDEIYYFRYRDPDGYGFQRLYTDRRDDTLRVTHGDVVAVRDGYHPFVTAYGYDAYYLNVLAGTRRSMAASDDPRHARFRRDWPPADPRLPLVPPPEGMSRT